ncbi:MAG TPA: sugar phosphate isomerase/epimerase [Armatimonadota bacterium]|nr:sugar phosphate isomerase/epimerase [Armatimonadota bacterium]
MKLGFCTPFNEERISFASSATFDGIELVLAPGTPLDPASVTDDEIQQARDLFEEEGVEVLTVFHSEDYAAPKQANAAAARKHLQRAMDVAESLNTPTICCNAWVAGADDAERLKSYREIFGEFAKIAEDRGFRIGIENCPHGKRNIAWSPAMWERMFEAVPSEAIGLEFDPSHLVWEGIDPILALREFSSRVFAFHAKDTEVRGDVLRREGILGDGWWRYRIPGWGEVDWKGIFSALADANYDGDIIIEHEDPVFADERFEEGLSLGLRHLRKYMA